MILYPRYVSAKYNLRDKHIKLEVNLCFNSSQGSSNAGDFAVYFYFLFSEYMNVWYLFGLKCSFLNYSHFNKVSLYNISVLSLPLMRSLSFWCSFLRQRENLFFIVDQMAQVYKFESLLSYTKFFNFQEKCIFNDQKQWIPLKISNQDCKGYF